jgi:hypothetical protein
MVGFEVYGYISVVNERHVCSVAESFKRAGQLIREPGSLTMSRGDS